MEKLKKRQKYDPRKAIQEGKKKKKTTDNNESVKVEEEKKVSVKAQVKDSSGKKVEKTPKKKKIVLSKNEKEGHKKVQSQVDCWVNTKKQSDKEWVKQIK